MYATSDRFLARDTATQMYPMTPSIFIGTEHFYCESYSEVRCPQVGYFKHFKILVLVGSKGCFPLILLQRLLKEIFHLNDIRKVLPSPMGDWVAGRQKNGTSFFRKRIISFHIFFSGDLLFTTAAGSFTPKPSSSLKNSFWYSNWRLVNQRMYMSKKDEMAWFLTLSTKVMGSM